MTGASGFVGRAVCELLTAQGHVVRGLVRQPRSGSGRVEERLFEGFHDQQGIREAVRGADSVVHLAARVHQMREGSRNSLSEYQRINVEGTRMLARIAADEGVDDFVFASSVKAVGESNSRPWTEDDVPHPLDPYGCSKLDAERMLGEEGPKLGIATKVLRLPLVYGPGVKANMLRLFEMVHKGRPIPVGGIRNARSLVYVGNVASAVGKLIGTGSGHEIFFVSDGEDVSTPELVRRIGKAMGRKVRLVPVPGTLLRLLAKVEVPVASAIAQRLAGSLTVDTSKLRQRIGPMPFSLDDGVAATARWFNAARKETS